MSVAAKWKLKEKEAAAAAAAAITAAAGAGAVAKTDESGFRGRKIDTPAGETSSAAADSLGRGSEKSSKLDASKPTTLSTAGNAVGKQGCYKLPVGKNAVIKTPHTKEEPNCVQGNDSSRSPLVNSSPSKTPNGGKEVGSSYGGRRALGAGLKKEEPATKTKTDARVIESKIETDKDAATTNGGDDKESPFGGSGRTKGLAGFWANQTDEVKSVKKKRLTAIEDNLDATIVENSPPQQREGVARAEDPGEWKKPIQLQEGWTKNVANSLQQQTQRQKNTVTIKRTPICLIEDAIDERTDTQDAATKTAIRVKDISQRLVGQQIEPPKPKEKVVIDRSQGSIVLAENQPDEVDPDVVRSESASEEVVLEKGRTRNLLQHWKNTEVEYNAPKTSTSRYQGVKPAWILEIEAAKGNSDNRTGDYVDEEVEKETTAKDEQETDRTAEPRLEHVNETTATQDSERDKIKTLNDGDAGDKELSKSDVQPSDGKPPNPTLFGNPGSDKEPSVATVAAEAETTFFTVGETQRATLSIGETSPVCHETNTILTSDSKKRIEPDNDRFDRIEVNQETETEQIVDTESVKESVHAVFSSDEPDISVGISPEILEGSFSEKDGGESATIPDERLILESESRDPVTVEEDTANNWQIHATHLDQNVTTLPIIAAARVDNAEQSIDAGIRDEIAAEELSLQSTAEEIDPPVAQLPVDKDQTESHVDNFIPNPEQNADEELNQADVVLSDLNDFGQSKTIVAEEAEKVVNESSSELRSEVLKLSTERPAPDYLVPESDIFSTPTSDFNLLTFDSLLDSNPNTLGQPDDSQKTETTDIFSTLDDILTTDFSSFLLDENVDNTPCLLPNGPAEIPQSTETRENSSHRHERNLENDDSIGPIIDEPSESFASQASGDKRAGKREEEQELTKTENSQRSCSVM